MLTDVQEPKQELKPTHVGSNIYGSFSLGESEFALSASTIKEVVNEPDSYSAIPLSPDFLLGVFNLRGIIVPVVNLCTFLDIPVCDAVKKENKKIAIVEHGSLCLGLLFDSTAEVFNSSDVETCWFGTQGISEDKQIIKGVFKLDSGRRIVQILDAHRMLNLADIPKTGTPALVSQAIRKQGLRKQCIAFVVGDSQCALDISSIKEIVNINVIENSFLASGICLGTIDIRGSTVPVVNFRLVAGYSGNTNDAVTQNDNRRVVVIKVGEELFGLLVDSIENIITYFEEDVIPFPVLGNGRSSLFLGSISSADSASQTILLNHDEILTKEDVNSITKGHSRLFRDVNEASSEGSTGVLNKGKLITFSLGDRYGLDIREVREVIELPDDLIKTPNMSSYVLGMANLRGELIAVIDSRKLYEFVESEKSSGGMILVFERDGVRQGLMVDSVDSIMPFNQDDLVDIPQFIFNGGDNVIGEDVKKALIIDNETQSETICILDLSSLSARVSGEISNVA